ADPIPARRPWCFAGRGDAHDPGHDPGRLRHANLLWGIRRHRIARGLDRKHQPCHVAPAHGRRGRSRGGPRHIGPGRLRLRGVQTDAGAPGVAHDPGRPSRARPGAATAGRMSEQQTCDLLILGGGMSYVGAIRAAQLGMNVGLVERDKLGGTCLNRGCIPSKALLETADLLHRVTEQGVEFGLTGSDGVGLDYGALATRKDAVVDKHVRGVEFLLNKNKVTVIHGNGVLISPTSVHVSGGESGDLDVSATDLILATGSAPRSLPGLDLDGERIITSDEALTRTTAPSSVTIVGAGAIGVEWASLYRDFGAEVTLVEFLDRIVPLEDPEISKELARLFRKRGITIHAASTIDPETIKRTEQGLTFTIAARDWEKRTEAGSELILVAVGRRPLTEGIGLEQIEGVK